MKARSGWLPCLGAHRGAVLQSDVIGALTTRRTPSKQVAPWMEQVADKTYAEPLRRFGHQYAAAGIHRVHGFRHLYAQVRYCELAGWAAPAAGGPIGDPSCRPRIAATVRALAMNPRQMRACISDTRRRGRLHQFIQDAAVLRVTNARALLAKCLELPRQLAQFADAGGDMADVLVKQRVHLPALHLRIVLEAQQHPDLIQSHVERPAVADERQALDVRRSVDAVVAFAAWRVRQESLALVVADRLDLRLRGRRQFSDLHQTHRASTRQTGSIAA